MRSQVLNVCYAANNNYTMQVGVSIYSLLTNNKNLDEINIFILNNDFTQENTLLLNNMVESFGRKLFIINSQKELARLQNTRLNTKVDNGGAAYSKTLGLEAYVRFFIVNLVPPWVNQILYLDCDTIVCGSLENITCIDMGEYVSAVVDCWPQKYNMVIGMQKDSQYYNAGVQIINVEKWRKDNILDLYLAHIDTLQKPYRLFDQDIMNVVLENQIGKLDLKYNMMYIPRKFDALTIYEITGKTDATFYSPVEIQHAKENTIIIHYAGDPLGKPWRAPSVDGDTELWNYYFMKSPWGKTGLRKCQRIKRSIWEIRKAKIFIEKIGLSLQSNCSLAKNIKKYMDYEVNI